VILLRLRLSSRNAGSVCAGLTSYWIMRNPEVDLAEADFTVLICASVFVSAVSQSRHGRP
jgi:hypothetical protein